MASLSKNDNNFSVLGNQKFIHSFTLIEILLVVVIISILASLVAVAARSARDRARNSRIETDLAQVRPQAVMIKNNDDSYIDLCDPSDDTLNGDGSYQSTLGVIESDIYRINSIYPECYATGDAYCVQAQLVPNGSGSYCIDSTGYAGTTANCAAGHIACQ
jgi:prepilin-type N-terminal cleavage/methylation domain-containing protein